MTPRTKTEHIQIPARYLECEQLSAPNISEEAYESAENGDYKPLAIGLLGEKLYKAIILAQDQTEITKTPWMPVVLELVQLKLDKEIEHNICVNNAKDAREYQGKVQE